MDPADGSIFRITMEASPGEADTAKIMVEYGPVSIGGKTYVCPQRGVALSSFPESPAKQGEIDPSAPRDEFLNDVSFTDYHIFRTETRIIMDGNAGP